VQKRKVNILLWSVAACVAVVMSGCLKSTEPTKTPAKSYISILHLGTLPPAPAVEIFFNDSKVSDPFSAGGVSPNYSPVDPGIFTIKFKKVASDSVIASVQASQYDSLGFYSVVLYNQPGGTINAMMVEDDFSDLTLDKPFYRFFNASPGVSDLGTVDLYVDNTKVSSQRSLADNEFSEYYNQFQATTSGYHSLSVKLSNNDSLITTVNDVNLQAGNAYTIYLKGNPGGTGANAISIGVLRAAN
jgi:Domain of unknown function (DUF4397)